MQNDTSITSTSGALIHPSAAEWMDFMYGETTPQRKDELQEHLTTCPACSAQVKAWRSTIHTLDQWPAPIARRSTGRIWRSLRWAAAAALILSTGIALGRLNNKSARELAELKATVAQLSNTIQRDRTLVLSNAVTAATSAANQETLRMVSDYAQLHEDQRAADKRALAAALRNTEFRIDKLQGDLETVAINAQAGFEQTHQNINRVASFTVNSVQNPK